MRATGTLAGICLTLVVVTAASMSAQNDVDIAMRFFLAGGAYCFRVAPEGVNLSEEAEWTVMVLTSASSRTNAFRIRSVDPGRTGLTGKALTANAMVVTGVWRLDRNREDFFDRFASGIEAGKLSARVVKMAPPGLAEMTPAARAEEYPKFADRGSKISFEKVPDLTAEAFREYAAYFPD